VQLNEDIRDKEVRVVADGGEQLGIMSSAQALKLAKKNRSTLLRLLRRPTRPYAKSWITGNIV
jgi:translation initiation factor IF-3